MRPAIARLGPRLELLGGPSFPRDTLTLACLGSGPSLGLGFGFGLLGLGLLGLGFGKGFAFRWHSILSLIF